jgi:hypothetical protein
MIVIDCDVCFEALDLYARTCGAAPAKAPPKK